MIPFHQFQRYENAKLLIDAMREGYKKLSILEVGSGVHKNLLKFCKNDNITFLEKNIPDNYEEDEQDNNRIVVGDACSMKFGDNEFDIVVALDVYEHIPLPLRLNFLKEATRVSKKGVILSAPFNNTENIEAEHELIKFAENHIANIPTWLYEHQQEGLPDVKKLQQDIMFLEYNYFSYRHGLTRISNNLLKAELITNNSYDSWYYLQQAHELYNRELFFSDFCKNGLRSFFVITRDQSILENVKIIIKTFVDQSLDQCFIAKIENQINEYIRIIEDNYKEPIRDEGHIEFIQKCESKYYDNTLLCRSIHDGKNYLIIKKFNLLETSIFTVKIFHNNCFLTNLSIRMILFDGTIQHYLFTNKKLPSSYNNNQTLLFEGTFDFQFMVKKGVEYIIMDCNILSIKETTDCLIDILLVSYNHEKYIKQAIDSILMQKVNFKYRILLCDDNSTDNTVSIVKEYAEKFPGLFVILPPENNMGITKNYKRAFYNIQSKYVAILEGDDYWTDPNRLSYCLHFLEEHTDCVLCANRIQLKIEEIDNIVSHDNGILTDRDIILTGNDLAKDNFIGNFSSCFYRGNVLKSIDDKLFETKAYDWLINLFCSKSGNIGYLSDSTSVYRVHQKGTWSGQTRKQRLLDTITAINNYDALLEGVYHQSFMEHKERLEKELECILQNRSKKEMLKDYLSEHISAKNYQRLKSLYHTVK